jgi:hypothetical protein
MMGGARGGCALWEASPNALPYNKASGLTEIVLLRHVIIGSLTLLILAGSAQAKPLDQPVLGPKQLCFKYSVFFLAAGERVTDLSGSMEGVRIKVKGPLGTYEIGESEIFASPSEEKLLVYSRGRTNVHRVLGHSRRYLIDGPTSFSQGKDWPLMWLSGSALQGPKKDFRIFGRIEVRDPKSVKCAQTFTYGL